MRLSILLPLIAVLLLGSIQAYADTLSPWYTNPTNGHEYAYWNSGSWLDATLAAQALNAHLVTFANADEENWVWQTFSSFLLIDSSFPQEKRSRFWIGATDSEVEGHWVWETGEPMIYANWLPGEPNNLGGENWGETIRPTNFTGINAGWNDLGPGSAIFDNQAIFEREYSGNANVPEPSLTVLLGIGLCAVSLIGWRRRSTVWKSNAGRSRP